MQILYIGTDHVLDWTRRRILVSAGYEIFSADSANEFSNFSGPPPKLALLSNLFPRSERDSIISRIKLRWPETRLLLFSTSAEQIAAKDLLPDLPEPDLLLKIVGECLMQQHKHTEVGCPCYMYVDRQRRYIHVSDGACQLVGMRREEIIGCTIDRLTYPQTADTAAMFHEFLDAKTMRGTYVLRHADGSPIPVSYEAQIFNDGCMCSCLSPLAGSKTTA